MKGSWSVRKGGEVWLRLDKVTKTGCESEVKEDPYAENDRKKDSKNVVVKKKRYQLRRDERYKIIAEQLLITKSALL